MVAQNGFVGWCIFWCMQRTNIYLEPRQTEELDRLAAQEGTSRAEVIRRLLDRGLSGRIKDDAAARSAIDLSFGILVDTEVAPREPGAREEHLNRMWQSTP
ncbi:MAG TPA: CopG family transcriptional regulator [Beutenbergiaceae bacterium]|nr:CopG family transcriptional regulator [Beutenbergiaceae bacterium]